MVTTPLVQWTNTLGSEPGNRGSNPRKGIGEIMENTPEWIKILNGMKKEVEEGDKHKNDTADTSCSAEH